MLFRIALLALFVSGLTGPVLAQTRQSVEDRLRDGQPTVVVAHRSAVMGELPENTLAWVNYAITRGVDAIHVNPQKTADGRYVLMHDQTLNRMTDVESVFPDGPPGGPSRRQQGGRDFVGYYTLEDIKRLHIAAGGATYEVPTLEEAIDLVNGRLLIVLGLKSYDTESLTTALGDRDLSNVLLFDLYMSGTDQSKLRALSEQTGLPAHVILYQTKDPLKDIDGAIAELGPSLKGVHLRSRDATPDVVSRLEELGLHLFISGWSGKEDYALVEQNNPEPWKAAFDIATGVLTDQPEAVLELLGR